MTWCTTRWSMPGRTGSVDFDQQFQSNAPWATAAGYINVYKLYAEWVDNHASDVQLAAAVLGPLARALL